MIERFFESLPTIATQGPTTATANAIAFDSRKVQSKTLFVAVHGTQVDGHNYIAKAVQMGASVVVCQTIPTVTSPEVLYLQVEDSAKALSLLAAQYYGNPSQELKLVGVTGTNGKTTTATLLYKLFMGLGYPSGLLSTVVNRVGELEYPATHTTPDPLELNKLLREMVDCGCEYCFMEVSSHGINQKRTQGLQFVGGVFTNLTHDHLDYHKTFAEYLRVKKSFFDSLPKSAFALVNLDDRNGEVMLQNCSAHHRTYSLRSMANYRTRIKESHLDGTLLMVDGTEVWVNFIGRFNAYNVTAIYGTAVELGIAPTEVLQVLSLLHPVAGRFQTVRSNDGRLAVVDYAHTPDALKNVLDTIADLKNGGRVITVVGCGGDRDKTKRPIMAQIAVSGSDKAILTSDNPRSESPRTILDEMTSGLDPLERRAVLVIEDRAEAIRTAVALSGSEDIILIAGKGHETYQEIMGVRHHFDDMEQVTAAF